MPESLASKLPISNWEVCIWDSREEARKQAPNCMPESLASKLVSGAQEGEARKQAPNCIMPSREALDLLDNTSHTGYAYIYIYNIPSCTQETIAELYHRNMAQDMHTESLLHLDLSTFLSKACMPLGAPCMLKDKHPQVATCVHCDFRCEISLGFCDSSMLLLGDDGCGNLHNSAKHGESGCHISRFESEEFVHSHGSIPLPCSLSGI